MKFHTSKNVKTIQFFMSYAMEFDGLFSNYENIFSEKITQLNDGGVSRVIMILLGHRVRKIIDLLACYINILFSLFNNAFGKRSMLHDKTIY